MKKHEQGVREIIFTALQTSMDCKGCIELEDMADRIYKALKDKGVLRGE